MHLRHPHGNHRPGQTDEATLVRRYQADGDTDALRELVERMQPVVRHIARGYANRGEQLDDLVQVGCLALLKAIARFDVDRGVRLATFAAPTIAGEIKRHFRDHCWSVHVPRRLQELEAELRRVADPLSVRLGRAPTLADLARATGSTEDRVRDALQSGHCYSPASLDELWNDDQHPADLLGGEDPGYERAEHRMMLRDGLQVLTRREGEIVRLRFVEGLTQREIGSRIGVSQMHVSRLIRRSLDELRDQIGEIDATPAGV